MSTHVERSEESCNGVWKKKKTQVASGQLPLFEFSPDNLAKLGKHQPHINGKDDQFSRYIVYVDESGNHNLQSIDPQYPIFVLAFCVFHKRHYSEVIVPTLEKFKFNHFGHDQIVLHENEIRRRTLFCVTHITLQYSQSLFSCVPRQIRNAAGLPFIVLKPMLNVGCQCRYSCI